MKFDSEEVKHVPKSCPACGSEDFAYAHDHKVVLDDGTAVFSNCYHCGSCEFSTMIFRNAEEKAKALPVILEEIKRNEAQSGRVLERAEVGTRVAVVVGESGNVSNFLGFGTYTGDEVPLGKPGVGPNPKIVLDDDQGVVWGFQVWWMDLDQWEHYQKGREIKRVGLEAVLP